MAYHIQRMDTDIVPPLPVVMEGSHELLHVHKRFLVSTPGVHAPAPPSWQLSFIETRRARRESEREIKFRIHSIFLACENNE